MSYQPADSVAVREALQRFGCELRRCRVQAGHSQATLAEQAGMAQSTISRLERGLAPRAALSLLIQLGLVLERRLPLAFCPHDHACALERLDARGVPVRKPVPIDQDPWLRSLLNAPDDP